MATRRSPPFNAGLIALVRPIHLGVPLPGVQKFLGHANLATTSRDVDHIELDELRQALPDLPS